MMSALQKKPVHPAHAARAEIMTAGFTARDLVRDHLKTSLALCDDILARCEQMKTATQDK